MKVKIIACGSSLRDQVLEVLYRDGYIFVVRTPTGNRWAYSVDEIEIIDNTTN